MYFPMIGASSAFVDAGTASGRVMMAVARASLQAQVLAPPRRSIALAMPACAVMTRSPIGTSGLPK